MSSEASVTRSIAAPAEAVWNLISDLPRMGEWSGENTGGEWLGGATGPSPGGMSTTDTSVIPFGRGWFANGQELCAEHDVPLDVVIPSTSDIVAADRRGEPLDRAIAPDVWEAVEQLVDSLELDAALAGSSPA